MVMGLSPRLEGEEMRVRAEGFKGGDRLSLQLPAIQKKLIKTIHALGKPIVLVLLNGSAVAVNWANENIQAIVEAWYPGQAAGSAIADVLFGDYNPAGRLLITFYKSVNQLPPFTEYNMETRTYRYFTQEPLYPFGYGLSYTKFKYNNLNIPQTVQANQNITVSVDIQNIGDMGGDEVVQLYVTDIEASVPVPVCSLQGFQRIYLKPGEKCSIEFNLTSRKLSPLDKDYNHIVEPGLFEISIGGKQPGFSGSADAATTDVLTGRIEVKRFYR